MRQLNVLVTGAFERDNFGDLLYPILLRTFLPDCDLTLAALGPATTEHLLGSPVVSLGEALTQRYDAALLAGGAALGVSTHHALVMNPGEWCAEAYDLEQPPYLPELSRCKTNFDTPLFVNSVSATYLGRLQVRLRRRAVTELASAERISVRDSQSQALLRKRKIRTELLPDIVHAVSEVLPRPTRSDHIVIQFQKEFHREHGAAFSEALLSTINDPSSLHTAPILLVPAGTAPGHDSMSQMRELANHLNRRTDSARASVLTDRDPRSIVRSIASAGLVIGHSLHVRVVAAAYDSPRVSLIRQKVSEYAADWDPWMPAGIAPDALGVACTEAMSLRVGEAAKEGAGRVRAVAAAEAHSLGALISSASQRRQMVAARRRAAVRQNRSFQARLADLSTSAVRRAKCKLGQ